MATGKSSSGAHVTVSNNMEALALFAHIIPFNDDGQVIIIFLLLKWFEDALTPVCDLST